MQAMVWYQSVLRATGERTPGDLQRLFFPNKPETVRSFQRYAKGEHPPRSQEMKVPALVNVIGEAYEGTRRLFLHPLWIVLDSRLSFDKAGVEWAFCALHPEVADQFIVFDRASRIVGWDWDSLRSVIWAYPGTPSRVLDCLTAYLLILRYMRGLLGADEQVIDNAENWTAEMLVALPTSEELACVTTEMTAYVSRKYLSHDA